MPLYIDKNSETLRVIQSLRGLAFRNTTHDATGFVPCMFELSKHSIWRGSSGKRKSAWILLVLTRRYTRMMQEDPEDLPQLIVVDGGKGQLSAAVEALESIGRPKTAII